MVYGFSWSGEERLSLFPGDKGYFLRVFKTSSQVGITWSPVKVMMSVAIT
jgi:hypothetical protein